MPALHVFVPGLTACWRELDAASVRRLPALGRLLARAGQTAWPWADSESGLGALFGVGPPLPVAALSAWQDCAAHPGERFWLRADPVYLRADRRYLLLFDAPLLQIEPGEADALVAELNAVYAAQGLEFLAPVAERWYLALPRPAALETSPLPQVRGRAVHDYLPGGAAGRYWRGLLNEIQMLLHQSPVNARRAARGALPVNSVWFWGQGCLPAAPPPRWARVFAGDPLAGGLARLSGVAHGDLPARADDILARLSDAPRPSLCVFDKVTRAEDLTALEQNYLAPFLDALRKGRLDGLYLYPGEHAYHVSRAGLRRWWRWPWQTG